MSRAVEHAAMALLMFSPYITAAVLWAYFALRDAREHREQDARRRQQLGPQP